MRYLILQGDSHDELEGRVNSQLSMGWVVAGGVSIIYFPPTMQFRIFKQW